MAYSTAHLSSPTTLLALDPGAAPGGPRTPQQRADEEPFAALLAAVNAPAGGEVLPAGGNVLPHGAASSLLGHLTSAGAQAVLPPGAATGLFSEGTATARAAGVAWSTTGLPAALEGAGSSTDELNAITDATSSPNAIRIPASKRSLSGTSVPALQTSIGANGAPGASLLAAASEETPGVDIAATLEGRLAPRPEQGPLAPAASLASRAGAAAGAGAEAQPDPGARFEDVEDPAPALDADADAQLDASLADERRRTRDGGARADGSAAAILRGASRGHAAGTRGTDAAAIAMAEAPALSPASATGSMTPTPADAAADLQLTTPARAQDAASGFRGAPAELGESIAGRIRVMVDQGTGEARLRLNPPELGSIDVRISVVDDKTYVQITATHSAGREALEQSLPRLRELLAAGGLDFGGASVDGGGREAGAGLGAGTSESPYAAHVAEDVGGDLTAPVAASGQTRRTAIASGRVDLYA